MKRREGAFWVVQAAMVVGVIALVSLPLQSTNEQEVSTSSMAARFIAFTSGVSPQGLQLEVKMNSSSIQSAGAISARVEVFNTLNRNVSISGLVQDQNISEWNGDDYVCANGPSLFVGFGLFRGDFAVGNISAAGQPLQLAPPEVIYCAASSFPPGAAVTFLPDGDHAVVTSQSTEPSPVTIGVNATTGDCGDNPELVGFCTGTTLSGYWNDSIPAPGALNFTSPAFAYFPPGEYTLVATDLWNQYVYATFAVEPSPETTVFSSGASPVGLQLELTLNATAVHFGGGVSGQVKIVNTSNQNITVSYLGLSENLSVWSSYINVCPLGYFTGYAVFAGHFTAGNISSAGTPLSMVPSDTGIICPPPLYPPLDTQSTSRITFLPGTAQTKANETFYFKTVGGSLRSLSILVPNELNASTVFPNTQDSKYSISCGCGEPGLVGYYQEVGSGIFEPFSRGEYTVVAWDAWDQYTYATFLVQSPTT